VSVTRRLARLRVPLGFLFGIVVIWIASPTVTTLVWGLPIAALGELLRISRRAARSRGRGRTAGCGIRSTSARA
jgi:uncharacterized membrane protein